MACTTHLLAFVHAQRAKQPSTAAAAQQAAVRCLNLLKKIGAPYRASTQHADMLEKMMQECGALDIGQPSDLGGSNSIHPPTQSAGVAVSASRHIGSEAWGALTPDFWASGTFEPPSTVEADISTQWAGSHLLQRTAESDERGFDPTPSYVFANEWTLEQLLQQGVQGGL